MHKILSATGHRPNKLGGYDNQSKLLLTKFAEIILLKHKPSKVISGMALGWDIAIASAAVNLDIPFIAVVPFVEQWKRWTSDDVKVYKQFLNKAKEVVFVDEVEGYEVSEVPVGKYHVLKMQQRNKWMVDNSDGILALWNASEGGTKNCVDYAATRYEFPKEKIIYLWESWVEFQESNHDSNPRSQEPKENLPVKPQKPKETDVLVVDALAEIYGESTANFLSREPVETSGYGETLEEIGDALADDLLGFTDTKISGEIIYPHQRNPELPFSPYNAVFNTGKFIHVDEEYLAENLHWKPDLDYSQCDWEPKRVPDYREAKRIYLDIETLGLDGTDPECRCIMIGLMIEGKFEVSQKVYDQLSKGYIIELKDDLFDDDDAEKQMINSLFRWVNLLKPDAIVTHNGFNFDFTFIMQRCETLGIDHPMTRITDKERVITAASMYGQPIRYYPVYWTKPNGWGKVYNDGSFPQLVDTMHLAGQHDKIFANMTGYGLKYLAHYVGFRDEKRLELTYKEIHEYWIFGDNEKRQLIRDYLLFDLEDQRAVTNFFLVSPYYQQMYFPLPLQEICVASPARKHNANLDKFYKKFYNKTLRLPDGTSKYYQRPEADEKVGYEGAIVSVNSGIYRNFFKLDFSSMYPSIMLTYGLMSSQKDPLGVFLNTILTLRSLRYVYKDLGGDTPEKSMTRQAYKDFPYLFSNIDLDNISKEDKKIFKGVDNSLKVGINGGYGFLGVGFYNFNDISSAALVTAHGRVMLTKCIELSKDYCNIIECDSDGLYLQPKMIAEIDPSLLTEELVHPSKKTIIEPIINGYVNPEYVWMRLQSEMPKGMGIDLETNCPDGAIYAPAMKNYIFWESPDKAPKLKGVYRKRNRSGLQKEFPIEFIRLWAFEGEKLAHKFGNDWITKLSDFKVTSRNLLITHTIIDPKTKKLSSDEKRLNKLLIESGCGEIGEEIVYYWGSRHTFSKSGRKSGIKAFPIRRYADKRCPNSTFPCDPAHVNKNPNIEHYVSQMETKVIPYSQKGDLNSLLDMGIISKLMFTTRIGKADKKLSSAGMGEIGDTVSYYWGSIGCYNPTGKLSGKRDRFPVRVIINEDDSLTIDLQEIPPDIDKSLLNLNFNVEWYLEDLIKIKNEILNVVQNQTLATCQNQVN